MKKIITLTIAIIMAIACVFSVVGCSNEAKDDIAKIKEKGVMYIGITNYAPMDYLGPDDEWIGFDADLANMFGEELGVAVKFTLINWNNKVAELNAGYIDLIWNGMTADEELGKEIDFSLAYATNFQCAVVRSDSTIATVDAIKQVGGAKIAVEKGSAGDDVVTEVLGLIPNALEDGQVAALNEVVAGTSDVAIIDYTMAQSVVGKGEYAKLKVVDTTAVKFADEVFAVGARKGSNLVAELNKFLKAKYSDGTLAKVSATYNNEIAINTAAFEK